MTSIDQLYDKTTNASPQEAKKLQESIAYVLCNFNSESREMSKSLGSIRSFIFAQLGIGDTENIRKIAGIMTTSFAFNVPREYAMSPGPEDTRIALIIGKPVLAQRNKSKEKEMALEQRYVVALRVVDCRSVFFTAIYTMTPRIVFCAKGQPVSSTIIEEGLKIRSRKTCCKKASDMVYSYAQESNEVLQNAVSEGLVTYERLIAMFTATLGIGSTPPPVLKRLHSKESPPVPVRTDTDFIERTIAPAKRRLNIIQDQPIPPKRQNARSGASTLLSPP
jgi:hypothetical protein